MRIGIHYSPAEAVVSPTGVGMHILHMTEQLNGADEISTLLLLNQRGYERVRTRWPASLSAMEVRPLPWSERWMRLVLQYTSLAPIDRWAPDVDWIYCPREQPVHTRNARLAVTIHDTIPFEAYARNESRSRWSRYRFRRRWTAVRSLKRAALVSVVSECVKRRLMELFPWANESRIVVVGNGVAGHFFRTAQADDEIVLRQRGFLQRPYLLLVGGLHELKGAASVIELATRLERSGIDIDIVVAGTTHQPHYLTAADRLTKENGSSPIRRLGYVRSDELAVLMSHCLAYLCPSRYESFGIPAAEAMAAGAPVIATRTGALPEVVGDAGILVDRDADDQMFEAVVQLARRDDLRQTLCAAGRERAKQSTWKQCGQRLIQAMRSA